MDRQPSARKQMKEPEKIRSQNKVTVFLMLLYNVTWGERAAGDRHI